MRFLCIAPSLLFLPMAWANTPAESAVAFAEKLRGEGVDLAPLSDTAISTEVGDEKRQAIAKRLETIASGLKGGRIEAGPEVLEGDLAAVLVRKVEGFDPGRIRVLPLAMIRQGGVWRAAPVPASFENTGVSFIPSTGPIVRRLEAWLAREQVRETVRLREESARSMRDTLTRDLSADEMRSWSADQAADAFLAACEKRQLNRILAMIGGIDNPLPPDWPAVLALAQAAAVDPAAAMDAWRLLTSPTVLRVPVFSDQAGPDSLTKTIAVLDPAAGEGGEITCLDIEVIRSDSGLWRIRVPEALPSPETSMLDLFPSRLILKHPPEPADSASAMRERFLQALQSNQPHAWVPLITLKGEPPVMNSTCLVASSWFHEHGKPASSSLVIELGFRENGDRAWLAMQWRKRPSAQFAPTLFIFEKSPMGWLWNPVPEPSDVETANQWVEGHSSQWELDWPQLATARCAKPDVEAAAPTVEDASSAMRRWMKTLRDGNPSDVIALSCHLSMPDSALLLIRNLEREARAVRESPKLATVTGAVSGRHVTLVGTREGDSNGPPDYLHPWVATPEGPRRLLEVELGNPDRPGREFLNRKSIERIGATNPALAEEIGDLLKKMTPPKDPSR